MGRGSHSSLIIGVTAALGGVLLGLMGSGGTIFAVLGGGMLLVSALLALRTDTRRPDTGGDSEFDQAAHDRARAIAEMASLVGASLDPQNVLEAAINIGVMGLREGKEHARLVGMVLLWEGKQLKVAYSRRLTNRDQSLTTPGKLGILRQALETAEPVVAGNVQDDPELSYFVAFQDSKSILIIPLRSNYHTYGLLVYGSAEPNAFSREHLEVLNAIGTQASLALQNAALYQDLRDEKERIIAAEEDARKKLARDLHDGPTQTVSAIAMRVNYIKLVLEKDPSVVKAELDKVEEIARRTTLEIRHMLFTLRPLVLETQGLVAALEQLRSKLKDTHNLDLSLEIEGGIVERIPGHVQGTLFYIVEEALNNARKHAQARNHIVRLYRRDTFLVTEIEDNGVGFDLNAVSANYSERGSLGMVNMKERAALIEGTIKLESSKGVGTRITVTVPIPERPAAPARTNGTRTPAAPISKAAPRTESIPPRGSR
ncbi:two-component system, NarL family, sensor kinase [Anaerolineae bacterium]|nr:two-component system, NarL family, sensor kinase [Anaerolineae bacterium]